MSAYTVALWIAPESGVANVIWIAVESEEKNGGADDKKTVGMGTP